MLRYFRMPTRDRRTAKGDPFDVDAWHDNHTGGTLYVMPGRNPNL